MLLLSLLGQPPSMTVHLSPLKVSQAPVILFGRDWPYFAQAIRPITRGEVANLTPTEFRLLEVLAGEPGRAFARLELLDRVFGFDFEGFERTVDVHVKNLRKKIEPDPRQPTYVKTVYGVGYKFGEGLGED